MSESSAECVPAFRMAREGAFRRGEIALSRLPRLTPLLCDDRGAARFELHFHLDSQSRPLLTGRVQATLDLLCQRCLETMTLELDLELRLGIVRSDEEAVALSEDYEPLTLKTDTVSLAELVEDELILGLPAAPLHPAGLCSPPVEAPAEDGASAAGRLSELGGVWRKARKRTE
ncbi:MAG TPA: YceD family protein [Gammaproteobacteria bacterium]|nr:YceD family protein [Gammaproteobacteria bacterium]